MNYFLVLSFGQVTPDRRVQSDAYEITVHSIKKGLGKPKVIQGFSSFFGKPRRAAESQILGAQFEEMQ